MSIRIVAQRGADGIAVSTANLYFTAHDNAGASVFRTAQTATPGQEVQLCQEPDCRFGDIVFAKLGDVFYGYFLALAGGVTTIRRIPLAPQPGQAAEVVGPPVADIDIVSGRGNLTTDGTFVYWQTDAAVSRMSLGGGTPTVLDTTPLTRPVAGLHLVGSDVIYAAERSVYHVPQGGPVAQPPSLRLLFTSATGVAAFFPLSGAVYVADRNGALGWHPSSGNGQITQPPGAASITALTYDASHAALAWSQMSGGWQVNVDTGANHYVFPTGANPRLLMFNLAGDLFWIDDEGVKHLQF